MSKIALSGNASGTGTLTLSAPNTNTDRTLTLPDNSGTVLTTASNITAQAMNGPAFSAYSSGTQSTTSGVATKVIYNTEAFDTASCFDSTTNYRFTPSVAGYYQINAAVQYQGTAAASSTFSVQLYKNGSLWIQTSTSSIQYAQPFVSNIIYLNGSTDYVEVFAQHFGGGSQNIIGSLFCGALVRGA